MISLFFNLRDPGIPCTTSSFTEAQIVLGNPWYPLKAGFAPQLVIYFSAILSNSSVLTPGLTASFNSTNVSATILPASRM